MDIRAGPSQRLLAQQFFRRYARRLVGALQGVPSGVDPEAIHQVRVACRRLRAGLRVFREVVGTRRSDRWRRSLRRLARGLGRARDLDVEIQATVERLAAVSDPQIVPGIAYWLGRLERQRARLQRRVCRAVKRFNKDRTALQIRGWCRRQRRAIDRTNPVRISSPRSMVTPFQAEFLQQRLAEFRRAAESLRNPDDRDGHHQFRIVTKKLRYSLEALLPALGTLSEVAVEALRQLQGFAGDIHDRDVWVARLADFIEDVEHGAAVRPRWLAPQRLLPGLTFLKDHYETTRRALLDRLVEFYFQDKLTYLWDFLAREGFLAEEAVLTERPQSEDHSRDPGFPKV